ncbi:MAG TPA: CoA-binding protein [Candidatus Acidoferrum sp.]|nr:CoA-binding protein [Candidatus Acidoferrum sp.]
MSADKHLIARMLRAKTIAVVGLSRDPAKPSHDVASYLQSHGYRIVPINPTIDEVLGEKAYKSLLDLPEELKRQIDVVDIFRRPDDVPPIVEQAVELHKNYGRPTAVWMQLGIVNEDAARKARAAGLDVVMDHCMKIEHRRVQAARSG